MAQNIQIPEPDNYKDEDFKTATVRVRQARTNLLEDPKAAAAHRKLGEEIAVHMNRKEATLAQVRRAVGLTQLQMAETLRLGQGDISRMEQRTNVQLSTLARFIEATGGRLRITAIYGDSEVVLKIGDITHDTSTETVEETRTRRLAEKSPTKRSVVARKTPAKRASLKS